MDYAVENVKLAREFIREHGGILPPNKMHIKIPGIPQTMFVLPENDTCTKYWVMLSEIYYATGWDNPRCLTAAIKELPEDEWDLLPMRTESGEEVHMYVVSNKGLYPLLLNNVKHFDAGLSFLSRAWTYVFSLKDRDYDRVPEPLRTHLRFWDLVEPDTTKHLLTVKDLMDSFGLGREAVEAMMTGRMERVWDEERSSWIYRTK